MKTLLSPTATVLTFGGIGTMYERHPIVYIRTAFVQPPEARKDNLMNHCGMLTITVIIIVILLFSEVISYKSLATMTRTNVVPTISEAFLATSS